MKFDKPGYYSEEHVLEEEQNNIKGYINENGLTNIIREFMNFLEYNEYRPLKPTQLIRNLFALKTEKDREDYLRINMEIENLKKDNKKQIAKINEYNYLIYNEKNKQTEINRIKLEKELELKKKAETLKFIP